MWNLDIGIFTMIGSAFITALRSLWSKKTRSLLTMLGVIIGVSQIITLIGLGQGVKQAVSSEVTSLGSNILFVAPGKIQTANGGINPSASVGASTLTEGDVTALRQLPGVESVIPLGLMAGVPSVGDRPALGTIIMASEPNFLDLLTMYKLKYGRFFTTSEGAAQARVVVLAKDAAANIFPGVDPGTVVGQEIQIGKNPFKVVGIIDMEQTSPIFAEGGNSGGGLAVIPYATAQSLNANTQIFRIGIRLDSDIQPKEFKSQVADLLKNRHGADDTSVLTQEDILKVVDSILSLITKAIVALSSISLLVGGIGIMNIMLVAVSERTKEIGLRKALGATKAAVLGQFLTEAIILSLFGGAIGVGIATAASIVVKAKADFTIVVDWNSIVIATLFSLGVGVIFGFLPAWRAARKDPIEALRYE